MYWSKTHGVKSKYKCNLYFTFEFINIHNRSCRKFFFFLSLTRLFITTTYGRFSTGPAQAKKQYAHTKICFSFKIKNRIILFELEGKLKNNLRLFKLDSKILYTSNILVYHNAITSTKWRNMKAIPTLILLEDISIKIIERGFL